MKLTGQDFNLSFEECNHFFAGSGFHHALTEPRVKKTPLRYGLD
jgi:hypothetical protein